MSKHRAEPAPSRSSPPPPPPPQPRQRQQARASTRARTILFALMSVALIVGVGTLAHQVLNRTSPNPNPSPAPSSAAPAVASVLSRNGLTLTNPDGLASWPMPDRMVFNRIQYPADDHEAVHDTGTARLGNTTTKPIRITALDVTGPYALSPAPELPATINPGAHLDVPVKFTADSGAAAGSVQTGTLSVQSSVASATITLAGWWQKVSEHAMEPSVGDLKDMFGLDVSLPAHFYTRGAVRAFSSDEVLSPYWEKLDAGRPVSIQEIASWFTYGKASALTWFAQGSSTQMPWASTGADQSQTVLPRTGATTTPDALSGGSIDPDGAFGFRVDDQYSDPKLNVQAPDRAAGCKSTLCGNYVRAFQLHAADGSPLAGTYLVTQDDGGAKPNYDYNDHVYILTNVKPAA